MIAPRNATAMMATLVMNCTCTALLSPAIADVQSRSKACVFGPARGDTLRSQLARLVEVEA
jgi:hypothetical protein